MKSAARKASTAYAVGSVISFLALAAGCGDDSLSTLDAASTSGDDGMTTPPEMTSSTSGAADTTGPDTNSDTTSSASSETEDSGDSGSTEGSGGSDGSGSSGGDGSGDTSGGASFCGDGEVLPGAELCDDGNLEDGDGCNADCQLEGCVVPMSHGSIQAGIDDGECSTIYVLAGTYNERIEIERPVIIEGVGPAPVILDAQGEGSAITINDAEDVELRQLVVTGGNAEAGGGVVATGSTVLLERTTVTENTATILGGGIAVAQTQLTLLESRVSDNRTLFEGGIEIAGGGGIWAEESVFGLGPGSVVADNMTTMTDGQSFVLCGGGVCALETTVYLLDCSILRNTLQATTTGNAFQVLGGGLFVAAGELMVEGATIGDNLIEGVGSEGDMFAGGGGIAAMLAEATFEAGTVFSSNQIRIRDDEPEAMGGGLLVYEGGATVLDTTVFEANVVKATSNTEASNARGAGLAWQASSSSTLSITDSMFRHGIVEASGQGPSSAFGGGIALDAETPNSVRIDRSTLSANEVHGAEASGAGIFGTIDPGLAGDGVLLRNSTISGNAADGDDAAGGAVMVEGGGVHIVNSTIVGNAATGRGGAFATAGGGSLRLTHSIVYNNAAPDGPTCDGSLETESESVIGPDLASCDVDMLHAITTDPGLSPLADNGGATSTHAIDELSAAYNASATTCSDGSDEILEDQRGMERAGMCTFGAFEPQ